MCPSCLLPTYPKHPSLVGVGIRVGASAWPSGYSGRCQCVAEASRTTEPKIEQGGAGGVWRSSLLGSGGGAWVLRFRSGSGGGAWVPECASVPRRGCLMGSVSLAGSVVWLVPRPGWVAVPSSLASAAVALLLPGCAPASSRIYSGRFPLGGGWWWFAPTLQVAPCWRVSRWRFGVCPCCRPRFVSPFAPLPSPSCLLLLYQFSTKIGMLLKFFGYAS